MRRDFYQRNQVPIVHGQASFVDPNTIEVDTGEARRRLRGKKILVAVGSRPYRPADIDFTHPRVRDSDTILSLDHMPQTITIFGAGVIGCEYASIFRQLSVKVNLINGRDRLLSFLDDEIVDALAYHLRDQGVLIRHNEEYERVEATDDAVFLHLKSGKKIKSDMLLWAQGRTGNTTNSPWKTPGSNRTRAACSRSTRCIAPSSRTSMRWAMWSALRAWPARVTIKVVSPRRTP